MPLICSYERSLLARCLFYQMIQALSSSGNVTGECLHFRGEFLLVRTHRALGDHSQHRGSKLIAAESCMVIAQRELLEVCVALQNQGCLLVHGGHGPLYLLQMDQHLDNVVDVWSEGKSAILMA